MEALPVYIFLLKMDFDSFARYLYVEESVRCSWRWIERRYEVGSCKFCRERAHILDEVNKYILHEIGKSQFNNLIKAAKA